MEIIFYIAVISVALIIENIQRIQAQRAYEGYLKEKQEKMDNEYFK